MAAKLKKLLSACTDVRGTLTINGVGKGVEWNYGLIEWADVIGAWDADLQPAKSRVVVQRAPAWAMNAQAATGHKLQVRKWVQGKNPQTPAQQANRARITAAVAYWRDHNDDAKIKAADAAKRTGKSLYHAFIQMYLNGEIQ